MEVECVPCNSLIEPMSWSSETRLMIEALGFSTNVPLPVALSKKPTISNNAIAIKRYHCGVLPLVF